ncbi:MAG: hypothetical protein M0R74_03315 [Dehalococcoidia bacterium]|nr:hypothetical protein [Dehalococcoidia bacterium]
MPKLGYGTTFTWDGVTVAKLKSIGGIELSLDTVDVTTHDSADSYKEFIPGLIDAGEISLEGLFDYTDTTGQHAMLTDMNARESKTAVITFPTATGATWTFTGYITKLKIGDAPVDDAIPFTASIKVTGKPTFAVSTVTGMSACEFSNDVTFLPTFDIATFDYVITITNAQTSTVVTPTDSTAGEVITITANGASQVVKTGEASSAIPLDADEMTDIVVTISATGKAPKVYTFHCVILAA